LATNARISCLQIYADDRGAISRSIVDDNDVEETVSLGLEAPQHCRNRPFCVEDGDQDSDRRLARHWDVPLPINMRSGSEAADRMIRRQRE
jgi:hypothetical protein